LAFLTTALTQAVKDACLKRCLGEMDAVVAVTAYSTLAACFFWVAAGLEPFPVLAGEFWIILAIGGLLGVVTFALYGKALKGGDMSLTLPMLAFTPLFLLVTSPLTLGEFPSPAGVGGLLCVVGGSYVLNLRERRKGFWGPVRALWTNRFARLMLLVAAIWSVGANVDKLGLRASSPGSGSPRCLYGQCLGPAAAHAAPCPQRTGPDRADAGLACGRRLPGSGGTRLPDARPAPDHGFLCHRGQTPEHRVRGTHRSGLFPEPDVLHRLPGALIMGTGVFFIAVFG
jgi:uncharacterized membrane protein